MNNSKLVNEEIDLFLIFKTIWKEKKLIFAISSMSFLLSIGLFYHSPKYYQSEASFFISSEQSSNQSFSQYTNLLGLGSRGDFEGFVNSVLKSKRIEKNVAKKFDLRFKALVNEQIQLGKIQNDEYSILNFIISKLRLRSAFSFDANEDGLFRLFYFNQDKKLAQLVLREYLKNIALFNESLDFSASKNFITVIDEPSLPLATFKPNLIVYVILGTFFGVIISLFLIYLRSFGYLRS